MLHSFAVAVSDLKNVSSAWSNRVKALALTNWAVGALILYMVVEYDLKGIVNSVPESNARDIELSIEGSTETVSHNSRTSDQLHEVDLPAVESHTSAAVFVKSSSITSLSQKADGR